jgi:hypothetical protein
MTLTMQFFVALLSKAIFGLWSIRDYGYSCCGYSINGPPSS